MTGFGKAECILPTKKLTIEIKSLNSKQIDTNARLPAMYKEKELELRQILSNALERGKVECNFHYEVIEGAGATINTAVVRDYLRQLGDIAEEHQLHSADLLSSVMRLPDTVSTEKNELGDEEWKAVKKAVENAIRELDAFRVQEGKALEKDLREGILSIKKGLGKVEPYELERIDRIKERIRANLDEINPGDEVDRNRFEQELVFYMEKLDINEEKVRLANHLEYFLDILKEGSPNGKKLGFISQEIGREINTLGSKANHAEIQKIVVEMKDELEKIKEQLLNVL